MREIEFRGKRKDNWQWIYGSLVIDNNKYYIATQVNYCISTDKYDVYNDDYSVMMYEVDPETVGQYTGLKDFNGIKIFENDILKFLNKYSDDEPVSRSKVYTFDETPFCIDVETGEYDVTTLAWAMEHNIEDVEVIGNIYDNPELLEKE